MRDIQIDDDVFAFLQHAAEPFVDTPNSVLRRVLGIDERREAAGGSASEADATARGGSQPLPEAPDDGRDRPAPEAHQAAATLVRKDGGGAGRGDRSKRRSGEEQPRSGRKRAAAKRRAPAGSLLPEKEYELPLLRALADLGGSGPISDVVERAGEELNGKLTELEREELSSGQVRWRSRMQFVRLRLIERGLMSKDTPRGVWALTDRGRAYVDSQGAAAEAAEKEIKQ